MRQQASSGYNAPLAVVGAQWRNLHGCKRFSFHASYAGMTGPQSARPPTLPPAYSAGRPFRLSSSLSLSPSLSLSSARSSLPAERPSSLASSFLLSFIPVCITMPHICRAFASRPRHGDGLRAREKSENKRERERERGRANERAGGVDSDSETTYLTYNLVSGTSNSFFALRPGLPTSDVAARMKRSLFGPECPESVGFSFSSPLLSLPLLMHCTYEIPEGYT